MTRRPDQDPLSRRLGDHGSRLPGEPSLGLARAVLDRLDPGPASLPPDRPARRRRLAAGALLSATVAAAIWLGGEGERSEAEPAVVANGLVAQPKFTTPATLAAGPRWIAVTRLPAVDAPPRDPAASLRLPPFPAPGSLDPLVAMERPLKRELAAVTAEAGALASDLFDRASLPLMKLGSVLRVLSVPR